MAAIKLIYNGENKKTITRVLDYIHPKNPVNNLLESVIFEEFHFDYGFYGENALFDPDFAQFGVRPLAYIVHNYLGGKKIRVKKFPLYSNSSHRLIAEPAIKIV